MRLSNVGEASQLIADVLADEGADNLVYMSVMVPPAHKKLVENLARLNRTKQAAVVRAIFDEWCELKRQEVGEAV